MVASPLGALGRVVGTLAGSGRVGGVVLRAGPVVGAGQPHVTGQRRFNVENQKHQRQHFTLATERRETFFDRAMMMTSDAFQSTSTVTL